MRLQASAICKRCDANRAGQVEAAFAFSSLDPAGHRKLVELIFSRDESWKARSYPRDSLARSVWYLLTTLWRVTGARKPLCRRAPRLAGRWRGRYGEQTCECLSVSATGALVRFFEDARRPPAESSFRLEAGPNHFVDVPGALLKTADGRPGCFVLQFPWPQSAPAQRFSEAIYDPSLFAVQVWSSAFRLH